jgi:putative methionine-R-sulfoxide reductase with GAF domain
VENQKIEVIISGAQFGKRSTDMIPGLRRANDGKYYLDTNELEDLNKRAKNLNLLIDSAKSIMAEIGLDMLLDLIIKTVKSVMDADRATLFLIDNQKQQLWSRIAIGSKQEIRIPIGVGIAGFVAQSRDTVNIKDA